MRFLVASLLVISSATAHAADPAVNVGVLEVATLRGQHIGLYPYLAASLIFAWEDVALIPSLGIECSPELGAWGFVGALTVDFPVTKAVGIDLLLTIVHDQTGMRWNEAAFYAGLGAGASILPASGRSRRRSASSTV